MVTSQTQYGENSRISAVSGENSRIVPSQTQSGENSRIAPSQTQSGENSRIAPSQTLVRTVG